jgi:apolipoprotein N-acyltransferase
LPSCKNALLALCAAGLLILAFPDFEYWFLAWFALVPLMWAVERQSRCVTACFLLGWLFGTAFFFGTCWWLTYAPIHYAGMPWPLAYLLIFIVCLIAGLFPALFTTLLSLLIRQFGSRAMLAAPFVWVACEFARYWITGNDWNAVAYSQALSGNRLLSFASVGGASLFGFFVIIPASIYVSSTSLKRLSAIFKSSGDDIRKDLLGPVPTRAAIFLIIFVTSYLLAFLFIGFVLFAPPPPPASSKRLSNLVAVQPDVPMIALDGSKWQELREGQIHSAESEITKLRALNNDLPITVVLPESPMNYAYEDDFEFRRYINDFAARNNVSVIFNSSQPDKGTGRYFNSAVMVGPDGKLAAEYDKIYLLPFGEAVPEPLENIVPAFVGHFSYGSKYELMPLGDAKAGIMICFESHFGELSRRFVQNGADALIEMTNDGYLGPTPVLRQHLANAVFRAVETNRPVLRVTNVGITAYVTPTGEVLDPLPAYQEGTRVWPVSKSDGSQTFYVKYGDWFAWLCTIVTIGLVALSIRRRRSGITDN